MLRKRGKADASSQGSKSVSFFRVPALLVGLGRKLQSDCDSARSPTSPLEWKSSCNPVNALVSARPSSNGSPKCWDCKRMGLGIVDSINGQSKLGGKSLSFSENRKRINIPSPLSNNSVESSKLSVEGDSEGAHVLQRSRSCSSDCMRFPLPLTRLVYCNNSKSSCENICSDQEKEPSLSDDSFSGLPSSLPVGVSSSHCLVSSLSPREIELSEDYTRIISRGPNPKTTHVFGDCVLESITIELGSENKDGWLIGSNSSLQSTDLAKYSNEFLSFCDSCNKQLERGKDFYIGEKAFCSSYCRFEILAEKETEKALSCAPGSPKSVCDDDEEDAIFATDMASASSGGEQT